MLFLDLGISLHLQPLQKIPAIAPKIVPVSKFLDYMEVTIIHVSSIMKDNLDNTISICIMNTWNYFACYISPQ